MAPGRNSRTIFSNHVPTGWHRGARKVVSKRYEDFPRSPPRICRRALVLFAAGCTKEKTVARARRPRRAGTAAEQPRSRQAPTRRRATPQPQPQQTGGKTPPSRLPDARNPPRIDELLARIEDAYFDYNQHNLRPDAIKALQADSTELRDIIVQYPDYHLTIEGHADERGSEEYNLALGDARAKAAKAYLVQVGIPDAQLSRRELRKRQAHLRRARRSVLAEESAHPHRSRARTVVAALAQ